MAAIIETGSQFVYTGKGPLDSKALVKTFAELIDRNTWIVNGASTAYNGMIVSVWLNKEDSTKNGIYYLFDPACTTTIKNPDVTNEENWIKLGGVEDTSELVGQLKNIQNQLESLSSRVDVLEANGSEVVTYAYRAGFPTTGEANKLYVAADQKRTYVWVDGTGYILVGTGFEETDDGHILIDGGSADDE